MFFTNEGNNGQISNQAKEEIKISQEKQQCVIVKELEQSSFFTLFYACAIVEET